MKAFVFQHFENEDSVFLVTAKNEESAIKKFKQHLKQLDMDLDVDSMCDDYMILYPEIIQ